jgi:hypothetical protein
MGEGEGDGGISANIDFFPPFSYLFFRWWSIRRENHRS